VIASRRHHINNVEFDKQRPRSPTVQEKLQIRQTSAERLRGCLQPSRKDEAARQFYASMVLVRTPTPRHSLPPRSFGACVLTEGMCSTVISVFAMIILSVLGLLFNSNHHELVGSDEDPENGPEVAATVFLAVAVYAVRSISSASSKRWKRVHAIALGNTGEQENIC
jgi:hypothetical protein